MTDPTPIERAAEPAHMAYMYTAATNDHHVVWPAIAHAVFDSIDTDQLADMLAKHQPGNPTGGTTGTARVTCSCGNLTSVANGARDVAQKRAVQHQALAVKNWLTGKDTQ